MSHVVQVCRNLPGDGRRLRPEVVCRGLYSSLQLFNFGAPVNNKLILVAALRKCSVQGLFHDFIRDSTERLDIDFGICHAFLFAADAAVVIINDHQQLHQFFVCHVEPPKSSPKISL